MLIVLAGPSVVHHLHVAYELTRDSTYTGDSPH